MATTIDIEPVVELRKGVDDGATSVVAIVFTEIFVVVATVAAIASNALAVPLGIAAVAALWAQVRLLREAPLGFCEPRRIWAFAGLAAAVGVAGSLAMGEWLVLGSMAFMSLLFARPAMRAVRAIDRLCAERSQPADAALLDRLTWRRNAARGNLTGPARVMRMAGGEIAAAVVVIGGIIVLLATDAIPIAGTGRLWLVAVPAMIFTFRVRRRIQLSATERRQIDDRPPTAILRAFRDDRLQVKDKVMTIPALSQFRLRPCSLEEVIAYGAGAVGPPLIIGEPGERLPRLGAAREYVAEPSWHQAVTELMTQSALLLFVLGDTENLAWELATAVDRGRIDRVVIVAPPVPDGEVVERWRGLAARTGLLSELVPPTPGSLANTLIAVFFVGGRPVGITAGERRIWSYLVAIWFIATVAEADIASPAALVDFVARHLPSAAVSVTG